MKLSHLEIVSGLNSSPEVVSRLLKKLEAKVCNGRSVIQWVAGDKSLTTDDFAET